MAQDANGLNTLVIVKRSGIEPIPAKAPVSCAWGFPTTGLQLGIYFEKDAYVAGEPITATLVLKNISTTTVEVAWGSPVESFVKLIATTASGKVIADMDAELAKRFSRGGGLTGYAIDPGFQHRVEMRVDEFFDLHVPDTYYVTAVERRVPVADGSYAEVRSGNAMFRLIARANTNVNVGNASPVTNSWVRPPYSVLNQTPVTVTKSPQQPAFTAVRQGRAQTQNETKRDEAVSIGRVNRNLAEAQPGNSVTTRNGILSFVVLLLAGIIGWIVYRASKRA